MRFQFPIFSQNGNPHILVLPFNHLPNFVDAVLDDIYYMGVVNVEIRARNLSALLVVIANQFPSRFPYSF